METVSSAAIPLGRRIVALDGIRGLMTIFVLVSHYFAEVPSGLGFLAFGWVAVDMFFVLSGLLVGRLILDKGHHPNFLAVFYVRRVCRTFPIYFICLLIGLTAVQLVPAMKNPGADAVPLWSYFLFVQNVYMAVRDNIGLHCLAPTWTMSVEEQFYLIAPALLLATPRRHHLTVLAIAVVSSVVLRVLVFRHGLSPLAGLALLPTRADSLACGLIAAVIVARHHVNASSSWFRALPVSALVAVVVISLLPASGAASGLFAGLVHLVMAFACACLLMSVVEDSPEAKRFRSPALVFFGNISYAVYLTHLPILWLLHALMRNAEPALVDTRAVAVTLVALPICVAVAWVLTKWVEEPFTSYGRSWKWSNAEKIGSGWSPNRVIPG